MATSWWYTRTENSTVGTARPLLIDTPDANTTPSFTATVLNNTITVDAAAGASADVTARRGVEQHLPRGASVGGS
jgi:hypothetical protein